MKQQNIILKHKNNPSFIVDKLHENVKCIMNKWYRDKHNQRPAVGELIIPATTIPLQTHDMSDMNVLIPPSRGHTEEQQGDDKQISACDVISDVTAGVTTMPRAGHGDYYRV